MKRWIAFSSIALLATGISSCGWLKRSNKSDKDILARVGDKYLYTSDINGLIEPGTFPKDSVNKVNLYVENWIKLQLMVEKAELNLNDEAKDFKKELEDLRTSLLIHSYQEKVVSQLLDTNVTETDIKKYYEENSTQFLLRKNLVKASYIIFSRNVKDRDKIKGWLMSDKPELKTKLMKFCKENALSYQIEDTTWQFMDELERVIPFDYSSQEAFLTRSSFYETSDSAVVYMVKVKSFKTKESISPLEFERPVIKSLIINIRKQEILRKMEEDIYAEGVNKKSFQNFVQQ